MESKSSTVELSTSKAVDLVSGFETKLLEEFPVIETEISYQEFFESFIMKNVPCLLRIEGLTKNWQSLSDWIDPETEKSSLKSIGEILPPNLKVPVADCDSKYFNSQEKIEMTLHEYIKYWDSLSEDSNCDKRCLYLKDWHFRRDCPNYTGDSVRERFL
jgi:hypothetical protein